jgi:L-threonylcarbamoyladenylate synthase
MITNNIDKAIEVLNLDKVIGLPTETVYGLAGNAFSEVAVQKIFQLKKRPLFNPLIVHIKSIEQLNEVATNIPVAAIQLADAFWPGPLTLVLEKQSKVPALVTGNKETVAVRIPHHPVALELLHKLSFPLAAPSANPFGSISPTTAEHVFSYFKESLEVILDGGDCERGIESTIIGFENNQPVLYRHGSIALEEIEEVIGEVYVYDSNSKKIMAPGMLKKHYAPKTTTILTDNIENSIQHYANRKVGLLLFRTPLSNQENRVVEVLSETGNLKEAARNLYAALHRLDDLKLDIIIAEKLPQEGLGKSINDRLQRAVEK